jgi:hypothetical protein
VGARAVLKSIIASFPDAEISITIVWINRLAADSGRLRTGDGLVQAIKEIMNARMAA